jgi:hypothetical protein
MVETIATKAMIFQRWGTHRTDPWAPKGTPRGGKTSNNPWIHMVGGKKSIRNPDDVVVFRCFPICFPMV